MGRLHGEKSRARLLREEDLNQIHFGFGKRRRLNFSLSLSKNSLEKDLEKYDFVGSESDLYRVPGCAISGPRQNGSHLYVKKV